MKKAIFGILVLIFATQAMAEVVQLNAYERAYSDFPWYSARIHDCGLSSANYRKCQMKAQYESNVICQLKSSYLRYGGVVYQVASKSVEMKISYDEIAQDLVGNLQFGRVLNVEALSQWTAVILQGTNPDQSKYLQSSGLSLTYADGSSLFPDLLACSHLSHYDAFGNVVSSGMILNETKRTKLLEMAARLNIRP